jgi:quinol-cytochrome oxidoreductase complex cytochrome b subunit
VTPWRRVHRWAMAAAAVLVGVLVLTGVWLWFRYEPDAGWFRDEAGDPAPPIAPASAGVPWPQALHAVVGGTVGIVVLLAVLAAWAARREARDRPVGLAATVAALGLAFGAAYSGYLIAWEQLALWSVAVDREVRGMGVLWDPDVRFVIVGGTEISPGTVQAWAVAHVVLGLAVTAAVVLVLRHARRSEPAVAPDAGASGATAGSGGGHG